MVDQNGYNSFITLDVLGLKLLHERHQAICIPSMNARPSIYLYCRSVFSKCTNPRASLGSNWPLRPQFKSWVSLTPEQPEGQVSSNVLPFVQLVFKCKEHEHAVCENKIIKIHWKEFLALYTLHTHPLCNKHRLLPSGHRYIQQSLKKTT